MNKTHQIRVGNVIRDLPLREVKPGVTVALFDILDDTEMTEAAGKELASKIPPGVDLLLMPDGKAVALLHVVAREAGLARLVARKERKPYMIEPVMKVTVRSITTNREQALHLGADQVEKIRGKRVGIVDDVISTGGTLAAMRELVELAGGEVVAVMAVLTEGDPRDDVIALGHLPIFLGP